VEKKRSAGSTVAGAFLWNFIENDTPWTHLDIAGTDHKHVPDNFREAGATGEIVRTLIDYIENK
jgi:leucyl aminopeptidase